MNFDIQCLDPPLVVLKYLSSDLKQINISDVRDGNGCRVFHFIFGRKRSEQVYAISSFGVLALGLTQGAFHVNSTPEIRQQLPLITPIFRNFLNFGD